MFEKLFKISDAAQKIAALQDQLNKADESLAESHSNVIALTDKLVELSAKNAEQVIRIAELEEGKAVASDVAAEIVASVGAGEPVASLPSVAEKTHDELWADYQSLAGGERNNFYAQNRARMFRN
jgi:septal ring factor EnvC (AmiA/AmiB activator)